MTRYHKIKIMASVLCVALIVISGISKANATNLVPIISYLLSGSNEPTTPLEISVHFPIGYTPAISSHKAQSITGAEPIRSDGNSTIQVFESHPQLVMVINSNEDPLLLGWVDEDRTVINTETTAEVLVYYMLGVAGNANHDFEVLRSKIRSLAETGNIADILNNALSISPLTVTEYAELIKDDINIAIEKIRFEVFSGRINTRSLINPSKRKSGIDIREVDNDTFIITNNYRRRAMAFVDRISYRDDNQNTIDFNPSPSQIHSFDISPTEKYNGVVNTLLDSLTKGNKTWIPTDTAPIELPLTPADAVRTNYQITVIGPGVQNGAYYDTLETDRKDELRRIYAMSALDFLIPIISSIIISNLDTDNPDIKARLGDLASSPQLLNLVMSLESFNDYHDKGDYKALFSEALKLFITDGDWQQIFANQLFDIASFELVDINADDFWVDLELRERFANNFREVTKKATRLLALVDAFYVAIDSYAQMWDYASSLKVEKWDVGVTSGKVTLTPEYGVIYDNNDSVTLTGNVVEGADPNSTYRFVWTMTKQIGGNIEGATTTYWTNETDTTASVVYRAPAEDIPNGTEVIELEVFKITNSLEKSLGTESVTIDVRSSGPVLYDRKNSIQPGESTKIYVQMEPSWDGGQLQYFWDVTEDYGLFINPSPVEKTHNWIDYYANDTEEGQDSVTVNVYTEVEGELKYIGSDTGFVRVEFEPTIVKGSRAYQFAPYQAQSGSTRYIGHLLFKFPKVDHANSYTVTGVCTQPEPEPWTVPSKPPPCGWGPEIRETFGPGDFDYSNSPNWFDGLGMPSDDEYWFVFRHNSSSDISEVRRRNLAATSGYRWIAEVDR